MNRFSGLRFRIGLHWPFFFGVRKKCAENRGRSPGSSGVMAPFLRRASTSSLRAIALSGSDGTGVVLMGLALGGGGGRCEFESVSP